MIQSKLDRARLRVAEDLHGVGRRRPVGDRARRRSRARASSCDVLGVLPVAEAGMSPSAPVSRVFCAVGWPFIWRRPQPGRPIIPRIRCRLFTWHAAAVAWFDWYTPCRTVETSAPPAEDPGRRPDVVAGTPQTSSTRSGRASRDRLASSSKPTVCASTNVRSMPAVSMISSCRTRSAAPRSSRSRGRVDVGLSRRSRAPRVDDDEPRRVRAAPAVEDPHPEHRLRRGDVVADVEDRLGVSRSAYEPGWPSEPNVSLSAAPRWPCRAGCCRPCAASRSPPCRSRARV